MLGAESWYIYYAVAGFFGVLSVVAGILSVGYGYELVLAAKNRRANRSTIWFAIKMLFTLSIGYLLLGATLHGMQQGAMVGFLDSHEASQRGFLEREELLSKIEARDGHSCKHVEIAGSSAIVLSVDKNQKRKAICGAPYRAFDAQTLFPFLVVGRDLHALIGTWPFQSHLIVRL